MRGLMRSSNIILSSQLHKYSWPIFINSVYLQSKTRTK